MKGLDKADEAAKVAKDTAENALNQVRVTSQAIVARGTADTAAVGHVAEQAAQLGGLQNALGDVEDALKALTGRLAPARVAFALATFLVAGALFALGVLSGSAGSSDTGTTTTTTTVTT